MLIADTFNPRPEEREPIAGRMYFGMTAEGLTGVLVRWDGYAFTCSESDNVDMSHYHHLHECPPRG